MVLTYEGTAGVCNPCNANPEPRANVFASALHCRVFWRDPETGELVAYAAKSFDMATAAMKSSGRAGWEAAVQREVDGLKCVAGVPGVVAVRELLTEPNGAVHLIMEYGPLPVKYPTWDVHLIMEYGPLLSTSTPAMCT
jgi:hypothetical protein